ncbi:MAG: sulfite exporter TauE/SafE family protein [Candidatus Margulisiibacteriota bacterium]
MIEILGLLAIGATAGTLSGFLGVGGATILIPALLVIYKSSQHLAQGTSLAALLLPVGLLAVIKYWQTGNVNLKFAILLAVGFFVGALFGAVFAQPVPDLWLKKIFAVYLLLIALQMLIF